MYYRAIILIVIITCLFSCAGKKTSGLIMNYRHDICQSCFRKMDTYLRERKVRYVITVRRARMGFREYQKFLRKELGIRERNIQLDSAPQKLKDYKVFDYPDSNYFKKNCKKCYVSSFNEFKTDLDSFVRANSYCPGKD